MTMRDVCIVDKYSIQSFYRRDVPYVTIPCSYRSVCWRSEGWPCWAHPYGGLRNTILYDFKTAIVFIRWQYIRTQHTFHEVMYQKTHAVLIAVTVYPEVLLYTPR